ncbi:MAG TPA: hypothetical protein VK255_01100 [Patescibacteria group bacterium]|nr:hypothetical protein [Patescibacteria group bacterium]
MPKEQKIELLKKLRHIIEFQKDCLVRGEWAEFDLVEVEIEKLMTKIASDW